MARKTLSIILQTEDETATFAAVLASSARAGDCILLRGQIGAGKSALARAFIRHLLGPDTEVPSPTFTLVQTYDLDQVEIWHADLYRLGDTQEAVELGLIDAMQDQICLIEWPDLLGDLVPEDALDITLTAAPDHHLAKLTYGPRWIDRLEAYAADA